MPGMHCVVVYTARTRRERLQTRPCTGYTTVYTVVYPVHGCVVYPVHGVYGRVPYTRSCTLYTAVFTARVHGRLYGPCTGAAHVQVHDARAVYMVRP